MILRSTRKSQEESEFSRRGIDLGGISDIIVSEKLSRVIKGECEFALIGSETHSNNEPEYKLVVVDGGCTTSLTSPFENCGLQTKDN